MAGGAWDLSARMFTDIQDAEKLMETLFKYFKKHKVEISHAIKKSFPFLEGLRDRELITSKMYEDLQESCRNLVPIHRVMYKVLNELEKIFDLAVLEALFSEVNREEYPELMHIYEDFISVIQDQLCGQDSDGEEREERPNTQLRLEKGTGGDSVARSLTWSRSELSPSDGATLPEDGPPDHTREGEQINGSRTQTTRERNDAAGSHQADEQMAQESAPVESFEDVPADNGDISLEPPSPSPCDEERAELCRQGVQVNSCSVLLVDIKKEKPFYSEDEQQDQARAKHNQAPDIIVITSDSEELSDRDEPPHASTTVLRRQPVISNHKLSESSEEDEVQEATCSHQMTPEPVDSRVSPTFRKHPLKRGRERDYNSSESSEEETPPKIRFLGSGQSGRLSTEGPLHNGKLSTQTQNWKTRLSSGSFSKLNASEERPEAPRSGSGRKRDRCRILSPLNNGAPRKRGWPKGRKRVSSKPLKRIRKRVRKTGPRIPRDVHADLHVPELPVTCGNAKGTLYKELFKQGVWKKSIQSADGRWFTPREFEVEGNHAASKYWKISVRCHGWTLKELITKGALPDPPSTRGRQRIPDSHVNTPVDPYPQNSNECEVCSQGGQMYCCDTCPKSYHENCHIPPVETESNPWSCIFCRTKAIRKSCRKSQPCHQESEVLMKEMCDEEQLKCELLLLKVYCYAESAFFFKDLYYSTGGSLGQQGCMGLNKIKNKLNEKKYSRVKEFVQDVRLIFQNHKTFYRDKKFARLGFTVEAKFEKNFKNIFGVLETTPNNHLFPH